jgi:ribosomal protein L39E
MSSKRMKRHTDFHRLAKIQKRNTTYGIPKYVLMEAA